MKKKIKRAKRTSTPMLHIGPKPEAIRGVRDAMLSVLKTKAEPQVQIEAVRAIGKVAEIGAVTITNCTFLTGKQ